MCGRFALFSTKWVIGEEFEVIELEELEPRYNVAPGQDVAAVMLSDGTRTVENFRWGLVPHWAKDPRMGSRMINARTETLTEKPAFRDAFASRRCLIVADGFYEWRKVGMKNPVYFSMSDGKPFGLAGLWESWTPPDGRELKTCTIITTSPNDLVKDVHDRMPAIIPREKRSEWLDPETDIDSVHSLLGPYRTEEMQARDVSKLVNDLRNDDPDLIRAVAEKLF